MFENENGMYTVSKRILAEVVGKTDRHLKDTIVKYAKEKAKELGQEVEVLFIDKDIADEIIELGIKEYLKRKM